MAKSIKLKDENYIDSTAIMHNRKLLADIIYPVGSVYISTNSTNPSTYYGGTWEQITDRFLLACGYTYANGSTGGEATHTLTVNEIPSHYHTYTAKYGSDTTSVSAQAWELNCTNHTNYKTNSTGGGQAHNNMPPYFVVFMWKRIS